MLALVCFDLIPESFMPGGAADNMPMWLSLSLNFASGAMSYVVLEELFPEAFLMWKSKAPGAAAMIGILLGILLVLG